MQIEVFEKQADFLSKTDREVLFDGGIGSGKTFIGCLWLALQVGKYPKTRWLMAARDSNQLMSATDFEFQKALGMLGYVENVHYKRVQSPRLLYTFANNTEVMGVGAHNYDSVFRGPNMAGALADEVDFWKPEAFNALKGRIRVAPELIRYVSSPKGFNHVYEDFYINNAGPIIKATTYDNPKLSDGYIEALKKTYSPKLFQQEVLAKRLNLKLGQVYSEFTREKHVEDCKEILEKNPTIYFFTDYNIANYCGVYMVFDQGHIYAIGEEHLKYKGTEYMAQVVKAKYPNAIVVGDSAGNNKRDVAASQTNYEIFKRYGLATKHFRNPLVEKRVINLQSRLYHDRLTISPTCPTLIKDLELLTWKENGKDIDKSNVDLSHASDAYGYGVWYFLPIQTQLTPMTSLSRY